MDSEKKSWLGEKKRKIMICMLISLAVTCFWVEFFGFAWIMGDLAIDTELFWSFHPSMVAGVNQDGYRGRRISSSVSDGVRILCLGDSTTYGIGFMRPSSAYPARLEEILKDRLKKSCAVMNRGVPGYTIHQGLKVLAKTGPEFRPDAAVFYFGHNEWKQSRHQLADSNRRLSHAPFMKHGAFIPKFLRTARLWQFLRSRWEPIKPVRGPSERVPLKEFEELVIKSFRLCRKMHIKPIWIEYAESNPEEKQMPYVEKTRELCREHKVMFVEMDRLKKSGQEVFMSDGVHLSRRGNVIIATLIAEAVESVLLLPDMSKAHNILQNS